ncbi:MAG TPA: MbnP family protein [Flavipsychrobacter sp.]
MKLTSASVLLAGLLVISACKREKENVAPEGGMPASNTTATKGSFDMRFDNRVKDKDLDLGNVWYTTDEGDTYRITLFNYYISNVSFNAADGSRYAEPESYHLIKENDPTTQLFRVNNVPAGEYSSVSFTVGVDFYKNIDTLHVGGALDTSNGMYMGPGKGYVMAMMTGFAPRSSNGALKYHIGGYQGMYNTIKNITLQFKEPMTINGNSMLVQVNADASKWFDGPNPIDFATLPVVDTIGPGGRMIAENYVHMFSIGEHNMQQ